MATKQPKTFAPKRYSVLNEELDNLKVTEVYKRLVSKLETDLRNAGDRVLRELILTCPNDLRLAGYIYAIAKEDNQKMLDSYDVFLGKYESHAQSAIAQAKKAGEWAGQTNKESIKAWIAANVPAASVWNETIRKSNRILDAAKRLYQSYENRLSSLQTYAKLLERRRGVSMEEVNGRNKG